METEREQRGWQVELGEEVLYRGMRWRVDDEVLIGLEGQADLLWSEFNPDELEPVTLPVSARRFPNAKGRTGARAETRRLRATAYHEAGHAVAAYMLRRPIVEVSILPTGDTLGRVQCRPPPKWFQPDVEADGRHRLLIEDETISFLAGPEAEKRFTGRYNRVGAGGDHAAVADLAFYIGGGGEGASAFLGWISHRTRALVWHHFYFWSAVEGLVPHLLERERITGRRAREVIRQTIRDFYKSESAARRLNRSLGPR